MDCGIGAYVMEEKIIDIKDVNKGYRLGDDMVPVLKDINFTVKREILWQFLVRPVQARRRS